MNRVILAASIVVGLLYFSACKPDYPKCDSTSDCAVDGQQKGICVDGLCQECGADADCKPGFKCEKSAAAGGNRCVPSGECQSNFDCTGGRVCKDAKCIACGADSECGASAICKAGQCIPKKECELDNDCGGEKICVDGLCQPKPQAPKCSVSAVRFAFNEYTLTDSAKRSLETLADCLKKGQPKAEVTVEGHADERGTEEYNMALGEKRATAVKRFLGNLGVAQNRLRTVSYGEERPVVQRSDEEAWAMNRRTEFVVTNQ